MMNSDIIKSTSSDDLIKDTKKPERKEKHKPGTQENSVGSDDSVSYGKPVRKHKPV